METGNGNGNGGGGGGVNEPTGLIKSNKCIN